MKNFYKNAFTLIEILVGILIVSIILVAGFSSYIRVGYGKINLIQQTDMQKNSFYFSERLYQLIKEGGVIDYEEYFNRSVIGTGVLNGHYELTSGFGNFGYNGQVGTENYGNNYYYCISKNGENLGYNSCVNDFNVSGSNLSELSASDFNRVYNGSQQRYGQYSFQFIDYNSNADDDSGDENGDGVIIGDDDDEYLGFGPRVFGFGENLPELYLISGDKKTRTFLRWKISQDENSPSDLICDSNSDGCIGTVEFLKLNGEDWGLDHEENTGDFGEYDGVIDTWILDNQFSAGKTLIAGSVDMDEYWQPLFPTSINVTDFKIYVYPNIDYNNAWKEVTDSSYTSPYVQLNYKIKPSWETRKKLKSEGKEISINATVSLTDIFSK